MSRHCTIARIRALLASLCFGAVQLAAGQSVTPQYTLTAGATQPAGTHVCGALVSQTSDPYGPLHDQVVAFVGSGRPSGFCGGVRCETLHQIYQFRVDFPQDVKINSVDVHGGGDYISGGNAAVLRLLDANGQPVATLPTSNLGAGCAFSYSLNTNGVTGNATTGKTFFIDEFDYSTNTPYRDHIRINFTLGISPPTNLDAAQFGNSGTQIQLTWDHDADPFSGAIDGFEIERQTPSEALTDTWETPITVSTANCSRTSTGMTCAYTDNVPAPFATYSYRARAHKGSDESPNTDVADCFQLNLVTLFGNTEMVASFVPDASLGINRAANAFTFNHFNWMSWMTLVPVSASAGLFDNFGNHYNRPPPGELMDPAPSGWLFQRFADLLPYYWDEEVLLGGQLLLDPRYSIFYPLVTNATTTIFDDRPGVATNAPIDEHYEFTTCLVGVDVGVGVSPTSYQELKCFYWSSNFHGTWGGITDFRFSNLEPPTISGPGGIFNVQLIRNEDLPLGIRQALIQTGARGVSTAPKVDKDAPTTAAFLSGQQGTNGWYTGPVNVTLIATDIDGPSDIASTSYSVDGGAAIGYSAPFTVSADGIHTIQFGSVDKAGNVETPRPTQTIKIDKTPPATVATPSPPPNATGSNNTNVTVSLTATDNVGGSGVKQIKFATSGAQTTHGVVQGSSASIVITAEGTTTITFLAIDNAGNIESPKTLTVKINKTLAAGP